MQGSCQLFRAAPTWSPSRFQASPALRLPKMVTSPGLDADAKGEGDHFCQSDGAQGQDQNRTGWIRQSVAFVARMLRSGMRGPARARLSTAKRGPTKRKGSPGVWPGGPGRSRRSHLVAREKRPRHAEVRMRAMFAGLNPGLRPAACVQATRLASRPWACRGRTFAREPSRRPDDGPAPCWVLDPAGFSRAETPACVQATSLPLSRDPSAARPAAR